MTDPFMIRAHVPHWEASVADYRDASDATRRNIRNWRTAAYGEGSDETLDLYFPAERAEGPLPIHLFVHGGYWRAFSKDDYAFIADAVTSFGAVAALVDYSLMPKARMSTLVRQVRRAAHWVIANASSWGGDPGRVSASGHSAGGHLAAYLVARGPNEPEAELPAVRTVAMLSGLYDLSPISRSFLQPELQLTETEVSFWSPLGARFATAAEVKILVGAKETSPFHAQAAALQAKLHSEGARNSLATVPDQDHMTIVREFGRPGSACARWLEATIAA
jgi:arylformamidase